MDILGDAWEDGREEEQRRDKIPLDTTPIMPY
jgi:hypothetical protein